MCSIECNACMTVDAIVTADVRVYFRWCCVGRLAQILMYCSLVVRMWSPPLVMADVHVLCMIYWLYTLMYFAFQKSHLLRLACQTCMYSVKCSVLFNCIQRQLSLHGTIASLSDIMHVFGEVERPFQLYTATATCIRGPGQRLLNLRCIR